MPEGPETHYAADRLARVLAGETVRDAAFKDPALQRQRARVRGRRVLAVEARGKAILTAFDGGWTLYTHNHLLGFWRIVDDAGELTETVPRVRLETDRGIAALYAAPSVSLWRTDALGRQPYLAKLGPDVLAAATGVDTLLAHMAAPTFQRRGLAALLLDQSFAAGMGNYLRSEVLYAARLSPHRTPASLSTSERRGLACALLEVPRRSYRAKLDLDLPPGKDYLEDTAARFRLAVFEREGRPCPRCGDAIVNDRLAGRRLYWSPGCQA